MKSTAGADRMSFGRLKSILFSTLTILLIATWADGAQAAPRATPSPAATTAAASEVEPTACLSATASDANDNGTAAQWYKYGHYLSICRCIEVGITIGALKYVLDWYCEGTPNYGWDLWVLSNIMPSPDRILPRPETAHSGM
jgi:hypothetical protein